MYPRQTCVTLRLTPSQAEDVYYELLGLIAHYSTTNAAALDPATETALRLAVAQLEAGLARANALGDLQLQQLRAITTPQEVA